MNDRVITFALLLAVFLFSAVAWAAHPVVVYSQRLAVEPSISVSGLAVDNSGAAYLVWDQYYSGGAYVSKVVASGQLWTVRIGGAVSQQSGAYLDEASAVATDASGNVYVVGSTRSPDFPTVNAIQTRLAGGWDAFLAKLSPEGKVLYSTYLGGAADDFATGVAVDPAGNVYITGATGSADFPVAAPLQAGLRGKRDTFVLKIDSTGRLVYSTYFGGSGDAESGRGIAVDRSGNAYVTGDSDSLDLPTASPLRSVAGGGSCGSGAFPLPVRGCLCSQAQRSRRTCLFHLSRRRPWRLWTCDRHQSGGKRVRSGHHRIQRFSSATSSAAGFSCGQL